MEQQHCLIVVTIAEFKELVEQRLLLSKFFEFCYIHDNQAMWLIHSADVHWLLLT